ncbi:hypothetical protein ACFL3O_01945 [Candidatus Neomarinimicrobiota bacterium]
MTSLKIGNPSTSIAPHDLLTIFGDFLRVTTIFIQNFYCTDNESVAL